MKSGIYEIVCLPTRRRYIGSALDLRIRRNLHWSQLGRGSHHSRFLQRAWAKYGADNFVFRVLERVECAENLTRREQHYIDTLKPEFNSCPIAASSLGYRHTAEAKRMMSALRAGKPSPMTGKKHTPESRSKMSAAKAGNAFFRGKRHKESSRVKMSEAKRGSSNVRAVRVVQCQRDGTELKTFSTLIEAQRATGVDVGNIRHVLSGRSFHAGGFFWKKQLNFSC